MRHKGSVRRVSKAPKKESFKILAKEKRGKKESPRWSRNSYLLDEIHAAARVLEGRKVAPSIRKALVVPGSGLVKAQAEAEGLDSIFIEAGMEWREPGCSMCLAMNADRLLPGERCASTSNRNFEGRQGSGGRTHLVSPTMAAAAAVAGHFVPVGSAGSLVEDG